MLKLLLIAIVTSSIALTVYVFTMYMQLYTQNSATTAVSGIVFKNTLNLSEYNNVSSGNNLLGGYSRYTRSDRHNEVITVYCKDFCK